MFDLRLSPPDIEIRTAGVCRAFFDRSLRLMYRDDWPYFYRNKDLEYHSLIPRDLPRIDRGFSLDPDGVIWFRGRRATAQQQKEFWSPRPTGAVITRVPDCDPIDSMECFTEAAFDVWLRARDFFGVDDISTLSEDAGDAPQGLAQCMADLAARAAPVLWRGSKSSLAAALQWDGSVPALNAELRRVVAELAALGWCLARGGRTKGTKAREYVIMPLRRGMPENPPEEILGPAE
jgi:hypothetical protein